MEENNFPTNEDKPTTAVDMDQKVGVGVKVAISVVVIGAIAAGIFIASLVSQ